MNETTHSYLQDLLALVPGNAYIRLNDAYPRGTTNLLETRYDEHARSLPYDFLATLGTAVSMRGEYSGPIFNAPQGREAQQALIEHLYMCRLLAGAAMCVSYCWLSEYGPKTISTPMERRLALRDILIAVVDEWMGMPMDMNLSMIVPDPRSRLEGITVYIDPWYKEYCRRHDNGHVLADQTMRTEVAERLIWRLCPDVELFTSILGMQSNYNYGHEWVDHTHPAARQAEALRPECIRSMSGNDYIALMREWRALDLWIDPRLAGAMAPQGFGPTVQDMMAAHASQWIPF